MKIEPYYADNHNKFYNKDCRAMDELDDGTVQCVVTSPPYWGLRKYSGQQELVWGNNHCEHQWIEDIVPGEKSGPPGPNATVGARFAQDAVRRRKPTNTCSLCGAWKGAYGLEPTPEMYIEHTIEILREIRRVLRKDGVVFWNIGDSYSSGGRKTNKPQTVAGGSEQDLPLEYSPSRDMLGHPIIKPKDLCLIPFRLAIACQEDGWWVRSVIIWSKPNPMPESVTDRPTESHEYILMLTKSARYYWDADAVRVPHTESTLTRVKYGLKHKHPDNVGIGIPPVDTDKMGDRFASPAGRNIRSVWEFPTQPYPEAHFAVFPEKLPEICIKAATPEVGCCSECGAPWIRIIKKGEYQKHASEAQTKAVRGLTADRSKHSPPVEAETIGWQPTCKCNAGKVPSLVLDPFLGAGTVAWVAKKLNRRCVGYEISEEYCRLAVERCRQQVLGLTKDAQM